MTLDLILSIVSGMLVCIPLVVKLIEFVTENAKEKNWSAIVALVLECMEKAELLFKNGADRKLYVLSAVEASAVMMNYKYDDEAKERVSAMIDAICAASKTINGGKDHAD